MAEQLSTPSLLSAYPPVHFVIGLQDYQAALKINPYNEALQADTQRIRDIIQGSAAEPDTQWDRKCTVYIMYDCLLTVTQWFNKW